MAELESDCLVVAASQPVGTSAAYEAAADPIVAAGHHKDWAA